jgi:cytochrome b
MWPRPRQISLSESPPVTRLVWDLPLRLFHWLLVLSLAASWATAKAGFDWRPLHMRLGYFTIGLVLFRLVWGFIGPRHARFASFLEGPVGVWRYARGMAAGTLLIKTAGHNPLGGLMVVVMLVLLGIQTVTGLFTSDDIVYAGPYNGAVSENLAKQLGHIHHVLAIAFYTFAKKQRLVPAMFTGRKPAESVAEQEAISSSQMTKACIIALICAGLVYWLVSAAPPPSTASSFN